MFLLPYIEKQNGCCYSSPWSLWATSLGYLFLPLYFHTCFLYFRLGGWPQSFCHSLLLLFHLAVLFLTDPLYSIIPHTLGLERQNISSRGPSCVLSLSGPDPPRSALDVFAQRWRRPLSSPVPLRLGLQVCPGCIQLTYSFNLCKN